MAGKAHVLMVGLGVLMMTAAGGLVLQAANQRTGGLASDAAPTPAPETDGNAAVLTTTAPTATGGPSATTTPGPTPTPRSSPTRRSAAPKPTTPKPTVTTTTAAPATWRLVWSDEFAGTSLDASKWNARDNSFVDLDPACATARPENLSVASGLLTMTARKEDFACGSQTRSYTVSYLDTLGMASFTRGAFEVRLTSPNGLGLRPSLGLRPDDGGTGQLEVVELPGGSTAATQRLVGDTTAEHSYPFPSGSPGDGLHVYRAEWEPGLVRWLVDGIEVFRQDTTTAPWLDDVFGRPYHLRLAFGIDAPDAATAFPADLRIDYVRVYQR